jgi:PKD repeat protein
MVSSATGGAVQFAVKGRDISTATRLDGSAGKNLAAHLGKMLWRQTTFIIFLAIVFFAESLVAQTTFTVTDFGAVGDAQQVWVNTTAGSPVVSFTNTLTSADIGKTIELFGVGNINSGPGTLAYPTVTNCNQDYIGLITNVATDVISGATQYVAYISTPIGELPQRTGANVYCIYGTNNTSAFNQCLGAAGTNTTIYIPHGTVSPWGTTNAYLMIPWQNYTNYAYQYYPYGASNFPIVLNRGGLEFLGDGQGQTILMAQGAFKNMGGACIRSGIFSVNGPVVADDYPLIWTNLTFDGGLQAGYIGHEGTQPANPIDGLGWDGWSCAGLDQGIEPLNTFKEFANCEFRHMRGEMIKGITGYAINESILVTNCYFWDGNATAFNYNYAHTIAGCVFSNMYQVEEFYLKYPTNAGSYFVNNYATNIIHNFISLNGGTLTNEPYVISNNVFYCAMDGNGIATCPASSVLIVSNQFIEEPGAYTVGISIGEAGAQPGNPGAINTNIMVAGNTFSNPFYQYFACGGGSVGDPNTADNVTFSNNLILGVGNNPMPFYTGGVARHVTLVGNDCSGGEMKVSSGILGSSYAFISTNNNYWVQVFQDSGDGHTSVVNAISYKSGSRIELTYPYVSNTVNYLTVADASQIPANAVIYITNTTQNWQTPGRPIPVYLDGPNFSGPSVTVPPAGVVTLFWGGNRWVTNAAVKFTASPAKGVSRLPVQFNSPATDSAGDSIKGWSWNFGDGSISTLQNPSHTYTNIGTFYPVLTVSNLAQTLTASSAIITVTNPMVKFTASHTNACPFLTIQFTSPATDSGGNPIKSWNWDFGDGTISTAQSPLHAYASAGPYNPALTVVNASGIVPASSGPAITVVNPTVLFTANPGNGVSRLTVAFKGPAMDSVGISIKGWVWNFGDGTFGTGQNPSHIYTNLGTCYPALSVTNIVGVTATTSGAAITVINPAVKFTANHTNACPFLTIQFNSPATDSGGNRITNWLWNFGDGTSSTLENPSHVYTNIQTYNPALTVANAYGLSPAGTGPAINVVNPTVKFTANPSNSVSRLTAAFKSPSVDSVGVSIKGWIWNFGDGTFGTGQNPSHIYTNLGTYFPALTVTNLVGVTETTSGPTITVTNPAVKFTANHTNACPHMTIQFTSPAGDSGGNRITNWLWNFGDGTYSTLQNPAHIYTNIQTYNPALTVANAYGLVPACSGPAIKVINPAVQFTVARSNGVSRLTVAFKSPSIDSVGVSIRGWVWNFGDGTIGSGQNPSHTYTNIGTYYPALTVTNTFGLYPVASGPAVTVTNPAIKFTAAVTNGTAPLTVQFKAPNIDSGGNVIKNWYWNFGDGAISTNENPVHIYTNNVTYYPALAAINAFGLSPTSFGPVIYVKSTSPGIQVGSSPQLTVTLTNGMVALSWPTNASGYTLQFATNLIPPVDWMNVTSPPVIVSGQNVVTNSMAAPQMFFRLDQ